MRSPDLVRLAQEGKMEDATWETLPRGERGLQTRQGLLLGEEPHVLQVIGCVPHKVNRSQVSGPRLMAFWRNELGFLDCRYSNDYGDTWSDCACLPMTYQPGKV